MADATATTTTIDDLPSTVLSHILTFLPTIDAIQTTVISPKFRNLWSTLPSLSFDHKLFSATDPTSSTLQIFIHFITRTLLLRSPNSNLCRFSLRIHSPSVPDSRKISQSNLDSCIQYTVSRHVTSLTLDFYTNLLRDFKNPDDVAYDLPFSLLRDSSVASLHLDRCNVILGPVRVGQFGSMKYMHLEQIYLTDSMVSNLMAGCVNVETLKIYRCHGMKDMKIDSQKLKKLSLWMFTCEEGSLEISAPKLRELDLLFFEVGRYVMEDAAALVEASVCFCHKVENYGYWSGMMRLLGGVDHLSAENWGYKMVVARDLFSENFSFYNLKYLELRTLCSNSDLLGIAAILEHSPKLETLILDRTFKISEQIFESEAEEFSRIKFRMPNLRRLEMKCYWGDRPDRRFVNLIVRDEEVLERIVLYPIRKEGVRAPTVVVVKEPLGFQIPEETFLDFERIMQELMSQVPPAEEQ